MVAIEVPNWIHGSFPRLSDKGVPFRSGQVSATMIRTSFSEALTSTSSLMRFTERYDSV